MCSAQYQGLWSPDYQRAFTAALGQIATTLQTPHASPFESFELFKVWIADAIDQMAPPRPVHRALTLLVENSQPSLLLQASAEYLRSPAGICESIARMAPLDRERFVKRLEKQFEPVDLRCYETLDPDEFCSDEDSRLDYDFSELGTIEFDESLFDTTM